MVNPRGRRLTLHPAPQAEDDPPLRHIRGTCRQTHRAAGAGVARLEVVHSGCDSSEGCHSPEDFEGGYRFRGIPSVSTDSDILRRAERTPQVFAEVFDRHAGAVESFLRRRLGADAAEDALSETFLVAFRRRGSFDHAWESARPWLLGIAARVAAKHRAAEAKHWRAVEASAAREERATSGGIEEAAGRVDAAAAIRALAPRIAALSAKERDTLLLYAWSGLLPDEIAQALNIPVGTVWSRLHRIRRKLAPPGSNVARLTWIGKEMGDGTVGARA